MKLDNKINSLKKGEEITISEGNGKRVTVERSCDGKKLRFVRHSENGWKVFHTVNF
jgi:hypothetical protein